MGANLREMNEELRAARTGWHLMVEACEPGEALAAMSRICQRLREKVDAATVLRTPADAKRACLDLGYSPTNYAASVAEWKTLSAKGEPVTQAALDAALQDRIDKGGQ